MTDEHAPGDISWDQLTLPLYGAESAAEAPASGSARSGPGGRSAGESGGHPELTDRLG